MSLLYANAWHGGDDVEDLLELVISSNDILYLLVAFSNGLVHLRDDMS